MAGPGVRFLGWQPDEVIRDHYRRCRALLFPGEEDFGIVPVEALACGAPVIALGRGGAAETVDAAVGRTYAATDRRGLLERDRGLGSGGMPRTIRSGPPPRRRFSLPALPRATARLPGRGRRLRPDRIGPPGAAPALMNEPPETALESCASDAYTRRS